MFLESWPKRFEFVKEVSSFMSQTQRANVRKTNSEYSAKCEDKGKHSNKHKTKTKNKHRDPNVHLAILLQSYNIITCNLLYQQED